MHQRFSATAGQRLIYRNEPSDGAVGIMVVLAIAERKNMIAHAQASARLQRRLAKQEREARHGKRSVRE